MTAKLGTQRVSEGNGDGRTPLRGWGLGTDWQVTLTSKQDPPGGTVDLSVGMEQE